MRLGWLSWIAAVVAGGGFRPRIGHRAIVGLATALGFLSFRGSACAEEGEARPRTQQASEQWSLHFQATVISQGHGHFDSPYSGQNSLPSLNEIRTSYTSTLFAGARLWPGAEFYVNPELSGGRGVGGVPPE